MVDGKLITTSIVSVIAGLVGLCTMFAMKGSDQGYKGPPPPLPAPPFCLLRG